MTIKKKAATKKATARKGTKTVKGSTPRTAKVRATKRGALAKKRRATKIADE